MDWFWRLLAAIFVHKAEAAPEKAGKVKKTPAVIAAIIAAIGGYEGLRTTAYKDVVGVPTICYGETLGVKLGDHYTASECKELLRQRVPTWIARTEAPLTRTVSDRLLVVLVPFVYNIGPGAWKTSTMVKLINKGDLVAACHEFPRWNRPASLKSRRAKEQARCLEAIK